MGHPVDTDTSSCAPEIIPRFGANSSQGYNAPFMLQHTIYFMQITNLVLPATEKNDTTDLYVKAFEIKFYPPFVKFLQGSS